MRSSNYFVWSITLMTEQLFPAHALVLTQAVTTGLNRSI